MVGIQHARKASEDDKSDGKRTVEKVNENCDNIMGFHIYSLSIFKGNASKLFFNYDVKICQFPPKGFLEK